MERADEVIVRDMTKVMILYGILIQIICLIIPGNHLKMTIGLWIGVVTGIAMLIHIRDSVKEAVNLGEDGARKYMQRRYVTRYVSVVIGVIALAYVDVVNWVTLLLGIMGLKVSAYLQPLAHKLFQKFLKS